MRVALAYSGGLDTSVAARWLAEEHGHEVVAVLVDVGQGLDEPAVRARAAAAGAELRVVDARAEFVSDYCWPALFANALYEGKYPLVSALARPLIAAKVVEVARAVGAEAVAHGCTGKGNDQVRFETSFAALAPDLPVLAPVREAALPRERALALAEAWGIPVATEARRYSVDENLWGRTVECGPLEDPWAEPPPDAFSITADPARAPDEPEEVVVGFESGVPVALDGVALGPVELVRRVGEVAGRHGFGRVDMVENRLVGIKSRELYEVPAALALILAHRDLEDLTLERDLAHEKAGLERRWAELAYYGQWYGPLHASLRAFMASAQATVTGEVRLRFFKGSGRVLGRRSPAALYDLALATYDGAMDRFDHRHAEGFVRLWSLPIRTWAARTGAAVPSAAGVRTGSPGSPGETPAVIHRPPPGAPQASPEPPEAAPAVGGPPPPGPGEGALPPPGPLWAGRFREAPAPEVAAFTRSLGFDRRLAPYEVRATRAHVEGLRDAGVLGAGEAAGLLRELAAVEAELEAGTFPWSEEDEDVHSALERVLTERLGPTGARVHAGRSRNDLVAADLRMWVKDAASELAARAEALAGALADQAEAHRDVVLPGYTHLQRAQPVLLAHHLLAHAFPLLRDADRLERAAASADVSPLGAGALAGSTLPLPVEATAERLGFWRSFENSMDAVADRDFALEFLAACSIAAVHLSRLAEDLVLWTSAEFGFARPAEAHATGSSMMPQKRNPDVAELVRGKAGRVLGALVALATVLKGLPLAYNRDLQEDKEAVFDAHDTLAASLAAMTALVRGLTFDPGAMRAAVTGDLYATDLAEYLVSKGLPFREAHRLVGTIVAELEEEGRTLTDVRPEEWSRWSPLLGPEVGSLLAPEASVERRVTAGGTSPKSVDHQLAALRARLRRSSPEEGARSGAELG
ncbi:MAG TPA: argininosuccinate lyase [Actinomycetota bacterium]|nr:argininosuccinate lyase [Actinomycetota bacterium]